MRLRLFDPLTRERSSQMRGRKTCPRQQAPLTLGDANRPKATTTCDAVVRVSPRSTARLLPRAGGRLILVDDPSDTPRCRRPSVLTACARLRAQPLLLQFLPSGGWGFVHVERAPPPLHDALTAHVRSRAFNLVFLRGLSTALEGASSSLTGSSAAPQPSTPAQQPPVYDCTCSTSYAVTASPKRWREPCFNFWDPLQLCNPTVHATTVCARSHALALCLHSISPVLEGARPC